MAWWWGKRQRGAKIKSESSETWEVEATEAASVPFGRRSVVAQTSKRLARSLEMCTECVWRWGGGEGWGGGGCLILISPSSFLFSPRLGSARAELQVEKVAQRGKTDQRLRLQNRRVGSSLRSGTLPPLFCCREGGGSDAQAREEKRSGAREESDGHDRTPAVKTNRLAVAASLKKRREKGRRGKIPQISAPRLHQGRGAVSGGGEGRKDGRSGGLKQSHRAPHQVRNRAVSSI